MYHELYNAPNSERVFAADLAFGIMIVRWDQIQTAMIRAKAFDREFAVDLRDDNVSGPSVVASMDHQNITVENPVTDHRIAANLDVGDSVGSMTQVLVDVNPLGVVFSRLRRTGGNRNRKKRAMLS